MNKPVHWIWFTKKNSGGIYIIFCLKGPASTKIQATQLLKNVTCKNCIKQLLADGCKDYWKARPEKKAMQEDWLTIKAGTVVKLDGVPVRLVNNTSAIGNANNFKHTNEVMS